MKIKLVATFGFLILSQVLLLAQTPPASVGTYDQLIQAIREAKVASQQRVEQVVGHLFCRILPS